MGVAVIGEIVTNLHLETQMSFTTPFACNSMIHKGLSDIDEDVRKCFAQCTAVDTSDHAWHQARLSLSRSGLRLRSLAQHSPAAYIASLCTSGFGSQ